MLWVSHGDHSTPAITMDWVEISSHADALASDKTKGRGWLRTFVWITGHLYKLGLCEGVY